MNLQKPQMISTQNVLEAIYKIIRSKNTDISPNSISLLAFQTLSDLIDSKSIETSHHFFEILNSNLLEQNVIEPEKVYGISKYFLKDTANINSSLFSIKLIDKYSFSCITDESKFDLLKLYADKRFKEVTRPVLIKIFKEDKKFIYNSAIIDNYISIVFVFENIPFIFSNYDLKNIILNFSKNLNIENKKEDGEQKSNEEVFREVSKYIVHDTKIYEEKFNKLLYKSTKFVCENSYLLNLNDMKDLINIIISNLDFTRNEKNYQLKVISLILDKERTLKLMKAQSKIRFEKIKNLNEIMTNCLEDKHLEALKNIIDASTPEIIFTNLSSFTKEVINLYEEKKDQKIFILLKSILRKIGLEKLFFMLKEHQKDVINFIDILKKGRNSDLNLFITILRNESDKNVAFSLFPTICNFCTDRDNSIGSIIKFVKKEISESEDDRVLLFISMGLYYLISSHKKNLSSEIILTNKIFSEESLNILNSIYESQIINVLIIKYLEKQSEEAKKVIQNIIELLDHNSNIGVNIVEMFDILKRIDENADYKYFGDNIFLSKCQSYSDVLTVSAFFIKFISPEFEITSKTLNLCKSQNKKLQKQGYAFLFSLIKNDKIDDCICQIITSNDFSEVSLCSQKQRLLTLFELYKKCKQCKFNNSSKSFFRKIVMEFILSLKKNSHKTRRASQEVINEMINDNTYKDFLLLVLSGMESDDHNVINGSISCLELIVKNKKEYILKNEKMIVERLLKLKTKGRECYKQIINLYKTMILEIETLDENTKSEFLKIAGEFNRVGGKKITDHLKKMISDIKKGQNDIPLNSELIKISKLKFKRKNGYNLKINKSGNLEIKAINNYEHDEIDE